MIAMTTSNSISVKPREERAIGLDLHRRSSSWKECRRFDPTGRQRHGVDASEVSRRRVVIGNRHADRCSSRRAFLLVLDVFDFFTSSNVLRLRTAGSLPVHGDRAGPFRLAAGEQSSPPGSTARNRRRCCLAPGRFMIRPPFEGCGFGSPSKASRSSRIDRMEHLTLKYVRHSPRERPLSSPRREPASGSLPGDGVGARCSSFLSL